MPISGRGFKKKKSALDVARDDLHNRNRCMKWGIADMETLMSSARKYRNDPTTIMFICRALKIICDKDRSGPDLILTEGLLMLKLTFREHAMQIRTIHAALNVILTMLDNAGPRMHAALEAEGMEALLRQVQRDWTHEGTSTLHFAYWDLSNMCG